MNDPVAWRMPPSTSGGKNPPSPPAAPTSPVTLPTARGKCSGTSLNTAPFPSPMAAAIWRGFDVATRHASAVKAHRQTIKRTAHNRELRARLRTALKTIRTAIANGNMADAKAALSKTFSVVDKMAAKAGAAFVSPFVGRLDDVGQDGMAEAALIVEIFDKYDFECEVLVASVRHPIHVLQAARMGADVVTLPHKVFEQMVKHPLTDVGLARFLADAKKTPR